MAEAEEKVFGEIRLARREAPAKAPPPQLVQTRCPLCTNDVELPSGAAPLEIACPWCGIRFPYVPPQPAHASAEASNPGDVPLAGPLQRWLAGEPIQPRPLSGPERAWRWCRRRPYLSGLAAAALIGVLATSILSTVAYRNAATRLLHVEQETSARLLQAEREIRTADRHRQEAESLAAENASLAEQRQRDLNRETAARQAIQRRCGELEAQLRKCAAAD